VIAGADVLGALEDDHAADLEVRLVEPRGQGRRAWRFPSSPA
jgi:hypothetical protein